MEQNTNTSSVTVKSVGIRFGLILAVISIAYFLVMAVAGIDMSKGVQRWGMTVVTFVIVFFAHKHFKENGDGFMRFGQGFGIGFWTGVISSLISSVFTYIYAKFIDSGFVTAIRDNAIAEMQAKGQTDEQIEVAMKFVDMFTSAEALLIMGILFGIIGTIVISLIVSAFTKKENPQPTF
jgi:Protein of unknown function (DUF4199)